MLVNGNNNAHVSGIMFILRELLFFTSRHGIAKPNSASIYEETQMILKKSLDI